MKKSLFPEIDREVAEDRKAAKRERVQHARARLRHRDFTWTVNYLLEHGPKTEHSVALAAMEDGLLGTARPAADALFDLYDLWLTGKLWRKSVGIHHGSGEESFLYGIRGVHKRDGKGEA